MDICGDNRFEIIAKAKEHLLDATNIDTSEDEMKVLDSFLFRCWQMGWLEKYTEPQTSDKTMIKAVDFGKGTIEYYPVDGDEPQTNADQHFQGVESVEAKRCEKCKHFKGYWEFPSPKRDGTFERFVECGIKECDHEPKDESQTEVLTKIHELYANMEKLLRKSSAEIVGAIREQTGKGDNNG